MKRNDLFEKNFNLRIILKNGRWTKEEYVRFIKSYLLFGRKWKKSNIYLK